jgi:hypothetical protein
VKISVTFFEALWKLDFVAMNLQAAPGSLGPAGKRQSAATLRQKGNAGA